MNSRKILRPFFSVFLIVLLCTCAGIPRKKIDTAVHLPGAAAPPSMTRVSAAEPEIIYSDGLKRNAGPYKNIITTLAEKYGFTGEAAGHMEAEPCIVEIFIWEEKFLKSVETWYAVTAAAFLIHPRNGKNILSLTFVEESRQPLKNSYHLYTVLDTIIKELADVLSTSEE
jgi:hypothetical protein